MNDNTYYGSSVDLAERWKRHRRDLRNGKHFNPHLQSAWNLYGEENFVFEVVKECDVSTAAKRAEMEEPFLLMGVYNVATTAGGGQVFEFTDEVRNKLKKAWTPERRAAHSEKMKGKRSAEACANMRDSWTPERRALKSAEASNRVFSQETRAKIAEGNRRRSRTATST